MTPQDGAQPAEPSEAELAPTELAPAELASESEVAAGPSDEESPVMELLSEHVPLSLIIDLSAPAGPDSEQILDEEGEPEEAWWEPQP